MGKDEDEDGCHRGSRAGVLYRLSLMRGARSGYSMCEQLADN